MGSGMTASGTFTFKAERRTHPVTVTGWLRLIVRRRRFGHRGRGMVLVSRLDRDCPGD